MSVGLRDCGAIEGCGIFVFGCQTTACFKGKFTNTFWDFEEKIVTTSLSMDYLFKQS